MESRVFLLSLSVKLMMSHLRRLHGHDICVTENCALLGYYAGSSGNFLPTFRDNSSGNLIVNDDQNEATILAYCLFLISSTCFGPSLRPSSGTLYCIYSFCYCPPMLLPAGVIDEMELLFHLIHDTSRQQHRWTITEAVNTIKCS